MDDIERSADGAAHSHVFLGAGHEASERKTWIVIGVCAAMMVLEIGGGALFGSIALVADGLHMSTHAGAMLLAALAYTFARKHASDPRFSFGTGKFGDLAGFASAIVLAMIALLIGYEAVGRLLAPRPIDFPEAIAIATLGLGVNVFTAWILSGGDHHHDHGHGHSHGHGGHGEDGHDDEVKEIATPSGALLLEIHEADAPPRFRLRAADGRALDPSAFLVETIRPNGARQSFAMRGGPDFIESVDVIPEPHAFVVEVGAGGEVAVVEFEEHEHAHGQSARDNNMRAALVHIVADAAVSALVIAGLLLARAFGWLWIDPLVGFAGAIVVGSWALGLLRDTGAILLDMVPDAGMRGKIRDAVEIDGDRVVDLHLWRLGPGHLGGIVAVATRSTRDAAHYRARLARFRALSHVTVEVRPA